MSKDRDQTAFGVAHVDSSIGHGLLYSRIKNKISIRKSITASTDIQNGEIFSQTNLAIKRPSTGIDPKYMERIIGKKSNKSIKKDMPIRWEDIL